jgi:chitin synthase
VSLRVTTKKNGGFLSVYVLMISCFLLSMVVVCNIHDVSWGTKGDNLPSSAPSVLIQKGPDGKAVAVVEEEIDDDDEAKNTDQKWTECKKQLDDNSKSLRDRKDAAPAPNAQTMQDGEQSLNIYMPVSNTFFFLDYFKQYRTNTVLLWMLSNSLLVFLFTNETIIASIFPNRDTTTSVNP